MLCVVCSVSMVCVVVHGKQLWSCRDGHLTLPHYSLADLDLLSGYPVLSARTFANNLKMSFLDQRKEKRKYVAGLGIGPGNSGSRVRHATDCAKARGLISSYRRTNHVITIIICKFTVLGVCFVEIGA